MPWRGEVMGTSIRWQTAHWFIDGGLVELDMTGVVPWHTKQYR